MDEQAATHWQRKEPFYLTCGGALLLALATPPIGFAPLAWLAPLPWLWLIARPELPGKRPYLQIYSASALLWLWQFEGIRLAHVALIPGWIALALYVAVYLPLFIGLARTAVHRLGAPLVIAAPAVWVGLEVFRAYFLTGIAIAMLGHTQAEYPLVIQVASLAGGYAVSFLLITAAAGVIDAIRAWQSDRRRSAVLRGLYATGVVAAALVYGAGQLQEHERRQKLQSSKQARVVLIQGSLDTVFEASPNRFRETLDHYHNLTAAARDKFRNVDLLVWPESSCPAPYMVAKPNAEPPVPDMSVEEFQERTREAVAKFESHAADVVSALNRKQTDEPKSHFLFGSTTLEFDRGPPKVFNTAMLTDAKGNVVGRYDKMHAVMFGEYIPLARQFPILYRITPMAEGLTEGVEPQSFVAGGVRFSPSICFESTVPQLIRRQTVRLIARGEEPDVLINLTNDGWFWGSAILDHHFRCAIFRAVEQRKPMLVAANTGISAHIDGAGRVLQRGPRRQTDSLLAVVKPDGRRSLYLAWGDTPAAICGAFTLGCFVIACRRSGNPKR